VSWRISRSTVGGEAEVPGDKSIAHRALILAGLAGGSSYLTNLPSGADVQSTASCLRALSIEVRVSNGNVEVDPGRGMSAPVQPLDCGNSGTTMRLMAGVLTGQPFGSCLTGDESLSRRPMGRVVDPLTQMGACIRSQDGHPPLHIDGRHLHGVEYTLPMASAQVKSAVLLAGLTARGDTTVTEPLPTRDHTERMLEAAGVEIGRRGRRVTVRGGQRPDPLSGRIPGDPSSAAFLLVAASLTGGGIQMGGVNTNPTRTAYLNLLGRLGVAVSTEERTQAMGEPVGDVTVSGRPVHAFEIGVKDVALMVDELPLLALVATQVPGRSVVSGAEELRYKESDRIECVAEGLSRLGARIQARPDGWVVDGPSRLTGRRVDSRGDHRLAMTLAVAGLIADGETVVDGAEAAEVSYPEFQRTLARLGARIDED
jgi:3-phosphoshikimate 1-carboxyvinyltransferase